mgnify:CR=1 FL=1
MHCLLFLVKSWSKLSLAYLGSEANRIPPPPEEPLPAAPPLPPPRWPARPVPEAQCSEAVPVAFAAACQLGRGEGTIGA